MKSLMLPVEKLFYFIFLCVSAFLTVDFLSKGEPCVMGERKIFKKRKPGAQCALSRDSSGTVVSEPCVCADWDFEW